MKVAIYARYSSDMQRDASIEDQIRLCQERADREGWRVINCYTDHGISGASLMRPGVQMLMQHAADGGIDVVIAESLDRLSRDQENVAGLFKRLSFAGVKIVTLSEGEINELHIGLKGTMGALFLKDLADKTRRGLRGRVEAGKSGGGLTYGYDVVRAKDAAGNPVTGERTINGDEARIVLRIFEEYAAGHSPKVIARKLNAECVPGPRGAGWGPSTIYGNRERGTGIINNELYVGRLVWNRLRYIKDPITGKRVSRPNPEDELIVKDVPELRIVPDELWTNAKARQRLLDQRKPAFGSKQRPKNLFSFLLKCGCCGGGFAMISRTHYGCSNARNKGLCDNRRAIAKAALEHAVLDALQHHLMDPELCAEFCEEYTRHMNRLRMEHSASIHGYRSELKRLEGQRDRIIQAVKDGFATAELKLELDRNVARREELAQLLDNSEEAPTLLHPKMAERYRREVTNLVAALNDEARRTEAADLIRRLIDKIVLTPNERGDGLVIDLHGDLAGILDVAAKTEGLLAVNGPSNVTQDKMVAGVRNNLDLHNSGKQAKMVAGTRRHLDLLSSDDLEQVKLVAGARNHRCQQGLFQAAA
tara:strand:+ start:699 stop:2471 length:1773 start_codon:yes stop_codon:yes gene_type:complete